MGKIFISETRVNPMTFRILQSRKDKPFIIDVHYNRKDRLWSAVWLPSAAGGISFPFVNSLLRKVDEITKSQIFEQGEALLSPQVRDYPRGAASSCRVRFTKECQSWFKPSPSNTSCSLEEIPQRPFCTIIIHILKHPCTHMLKTPARWVKLSITEV